MIITPSHVVAMDMNDNYLNHVNGTNPTILDSGTTDSYVDGFQGKGYGHGGCGYMNGLLFSNGEFTYAESISIYLKLPVSLNSTKAAGIIGLSTSNYGSSCGGCSGIYVPRMYFSGDNGQSGVTDIVVGVYNRARRVLKATMPLNQWVHIFSNGGPTTSLDLYVNGELKASRANTSDTFGMSFNTLGIACMNGWPNDGISDYDTTPYDIDNVQAFDRKLEPSEIKRLYNGLHALR